MITFLLRWWCYITQHQPEAGYDRGVPLPRLGGANERGRLFNEIDEGRQGLLVVVGREIFERVEPIIEIRHCGAGVIWE